MSSDDNRAMEIFIKCSEKTRTLSVTGATTVWQVKVKLYQAGFDVPPHQQRLVYAGKNMLDDDTLDKYKIESCSTLQVFTRMCGD